jgi:hypothetical protein
MLLAALECPPMLDQGLEAANQATEATTRDPVGFLHHLIEVSSHTVHQLQSLQKPEVHGVQAGAGAGLQRDILLKLVDLPTDGGNHLFLALHASLEDQAGVVGLL